MGNAERIEETQSHALALPRRISDAVAEYDAKKTGLPAAFVAFEKRGKDLMTSCTIGGSYGRERIDLGSAYERTLEKNLLVSAWKFLKPGGTLTAILPATARYDHGLLDAHQPHWQDLPVGSFSESGTNINTTILTICT